MGTSYVFGEQAIAEIEKLPDDLELLKQVILRQLERTLSLTVTVSTLELRIKHLENAQVR